jgi:FOG: CBS domain
LLAKDIMVSGKKMPIINYNKNFKHALRIMSQKKLGILVIIRNRFIRGLVTDGDLRRELKNYSSDNNLKKFMTKNPLVVNENMPPSKALAIMNEKKITSLLVVSYKDLKKTNKILKGIIHIHFLLQSGIR